MRSRLNLKTGCTLVHWYHTLGCQCSSFGTYVHKVVPIIVLIAKKFNYFMTSLWGKNEVEIKFENSMHNYNATRGHWHHILGCQCSSFGTHAVHKVVPVRIFITEKCNYFMTSLRGKNEVEVEQSKPYGQTDGWTEIVNLIVGLVTRCSLVE